jgi:hypothetical protein
LETTDRISIYLLQRAQSGPLAAHHKTSDPFCALRLRPSRAETVAALWHIGVQLRASLIFASDLSHPRINLAQSTARAPPLELDVVSVVVGDPGMGKCALRCGN